jgi:hypothetical protein
MKRSKIFAVFAIIFGAIVAVGCLLLFLFKTTDLNINAPIEPNILANYGSLVGGVVGVLFSLAGVLLLIQNLENQETAFLKQQIENRFFELVRIARENSKEISIKDRSGKKVFLVLLREYYACLEIIQPVAQLYKLSELEMINLSYLCFFYGAIGRGAKDVLRRRLTNKHETRFLDDIFKVFEENRSIYMDKFNYVPFDGHQSRLGHYYRHLFQSVRYINEQPKNLLSYKEKYEYVKTLRAQLSNQEQALLFLNSLSDLGLPWERSNKIIDVNQKLITKYNLIKNIPDGFLEKGIDIRSYYPDIKYEGDLSPSPERQEFEKLYC